MNRSRSHRDEEDAASVHKQSISQDDGGLSNEKKLRKSDPQDAKNNNLSINEEMNKLSLKDAQDSASSKQHKLNFIEENHPIETEEWIVFLQKLMEEVIGGEMTSLTQPYLTNIIVSPLRNTNTSPKVLMYVAKLLSLPFALRTVSQKTLDQMKKVYLEVKLVPNLVYSSKQIMRIKRDDGSSSSPSPTGSPIQERYKDAADLTDEDFRSLESIYMLITHLVHLDNEFLSQLCDSIAVLNIFTILKFFLLICE